MAAYRKDFDKAKFMYFLIKDDELLEKYNEIQLVNQYIIKNI